MTSRATLVKVTDLATRFPLERSERPLRSEPISNDEWVQQLSASGPRRDAAVERLHDLMIRSAWHQISRMPEAAGLGARRREEIVHAAADEAAMAVLTRLDSFEGRSRFTTWAYKFGILHTAVEVRRSAWRGREVDLDSVPEPPATDARPEDYAEAKDLGVAVGEAMATALTPHQRRVTVALLVDEIPIDVLAERLGTNRNALYKTLHDSRKALRAHLAARGFLHSNPIHPPEKVIR
jgi:RNA polymerase sigma-70 factor (ECF subfamily)